MTIADPTGQARNRNRGTKRLSARITRAEKEIKGLFRAIPRTKHRRTKIVNAEQTEFYEYDFSVDDQARLEFLIKSILNSELLENQTGQMPPDWYWKEDIELSYRQGTVEEGRDFNQLIAAAIAAGVLIGGLPPNQVPIDQFLLSEPYRKAVASVQASNFTDIKSLSEKTASQVMKRINAGIQAGETPTVVAAGIADRFDVSRSDAKRISETEINKAYNDAKLNATRVLGDQTGLEAGVVHISALTPTTRQHHADRHGNAYTVEDQLQWWNSGANRINCKCTTRSVLIDRDGNVSFDNSI